MLSSPFLSTTAPISSNLVITERREEYSTPFISTLPRVIAAATQKVPASILSLIIVYSHPCKFLVPLTTIVSVPAPSISAPIKEMKLARSTTSGSQAALDITVSPSIVAASIITFSVAPTLGKSK